MWLIIFFVIVVASFVLAYLSMKDLPDILPAHRSGVFLIRNPQNLNAEILEAIKLKFHSGQIISFERLFKGTKSALVVFGPMELMQFTGLNLLELEDYTNVDLGNALAWQVTLKGEPYNFFAELPNLTVDEQFWWQITARVKGSGFQTEIRAVVLADTDSRQKDLVSSIQNLSKTVIKLPRPLTSEAILSNYQKRSIVPLSDNPLILTISQVLTLLGKS